MGNLITLIAQFRLDLKRKYKLYLIWVVMWIFMVIMLVATFTGVKENAEGLASLYESFPKELLTTFGIGDIENALKLTGYFNSQFSVLYLLGLSILAGYAGVTAIGKEIADGTITFTLSKPVSRFNMLLAKTFSGITLILASHIIIFASIPLSTPLLIADENISMRFVLGLSIASFCFGLMFYAFGLLLGVALDSAKGVGGIVMLAIISFFLNIVSNLSGVPEFIKYINPYYYLDVSHIADAGEVRVERIVFLIAIALLLWVSSVLVFKRRNIDT